MMDWEIRARQYAEMLFDLLREDDDCFLTAIRTMRSDGFIDKNDEWIENLKYYNSR